MNKHLLKMINWWSAHDLHCSRESDVLLYTGPTLSGMHFWLTYLQWQSVKPECENISFYWWSSFYFTEEEQQHSWYWTAKPESSQTFSFLQPSVSEGTQIRGVSPFFEILPPGPLKSRTVRWRRGRQLAEPACADCFPIWKSGLQAVIQSSFHCCTAVRELSWAEVRPWLFCFLLGAPSANSRSEGLWRVQPLKATCGWHSWGDVRVSAQWRKSQRSLKKYLALSRS